MFFNDIIRDFIEIGQVEIPWKESENVTFLSVFWPPSLPSRSARLLAWLAAALGPLAWLT